MPSILSFSADFKVTSYVLLPLLSSEVAVEEIAPIHLHNAEGPHTVYSFWSSPALSMLSFLLCSAPPFPPLPPVSFFTRALVKTR